MKTFDVVSLDMFQTLVNVDSRREQVWRCILSEQYVQELAEQYAQLLLQYFMEHWKQLKETHRFHSTREVYERSFESVFRRFNIEFDVEEACNILFQEHTKAELYEDTVRFLDRILKQYKVCIVSDADEAMVPQFYTKYGIRNFISEHYRSYKNDEDNLMFKALLHYYKVHPSKVIHIGDSESDIIGAQREGIRACWLNRDKITWKHEIKPDFIISSLDDLKKIL